MANLARLRCTWLGNGVVGPGLSTFYFNPANTGAAAAVSAFFTALNPVLIPSGLQVSIPTSGDIIDDATGALVGAWTDPGGPFTFTGTGAGTFAMGVGFRVAWTTNGIHLGRRVRGSTFICPIMGAIYDSAGTIANATVTSASAAAQTLGHVGSAVQGLESAFRHHSGDVDGHDRWLRSRQDLLAS